MVFLLVVTIALTVVGAAAVCASLSAWLIYLFKHLGVSMPIAHKEIASMKQAPKDQALSFLTLPFAPEGIGLGCGFCVGVKAKHAFPDISEEPSGSLEGLRRQQDHWAEHVPNSHRGPGWSVQTSAGPGSALSYVEPASLLGAR